MILDFLRQHDEAKLLRAICLGLGVYDAAKPLVTNPARARPASSGRKRSRKVTRRTA
jgi:hypothetical protein